MLKGIFASALLLLPVASQAVMIDLDGQTVNAENAEVIIVDENTIMIDGKTYQGVESIIGDVQVIETLSEVVAYETGQSSETAGVVFCDISCQDSWQLTPAEEGVSAEFAEEWTVISGNITSDVVQQDNDVIIEAVESEMVMIEPIDFGTIEPGDITLVESVDVAAVPLPAAGGLFLSLLGLLATLRVGRGLTRR
ncbi:hypothetical protein EDC56_1571 [Sinobacterium caligoides]|uniref:Secreted protein n=1 Tax=Sinobacterium caligoides TaxID=933926 RepID=A0A3N2DMV8_9GAMM|nr:hypothetical protein [Sinobacterium caligoides]ROS01143.1 hypothetical protein EDC56_1571 [Sinobacterium caligoides]